MESSDSDLPYKEGQWRPDFPSGDKVYDDEFMLKLKTAPHAMSLPTHLVSADKILTLSIIKSTPDSESKIAMLGAKDDSSIDAVDWKEELQDEFQDNPMLNGVMKAMEKLNAKFEAHVANLDIKMKSHTSKLTSEKDLLKNRVAKLEDENKKLRMQVGLIAKPALSVQEPTETISVEKAKTLGTRVNKLEQDRKELQTRLAKVEGDAVKVTKGSAVSETDKSLQSLSLLVNKLGQEKNEIKKRLAKVETDALAVKETVSLPRPQDQGNPLLQSLQDRLNNLSSEKTELRNRISKLESGFALAYKPNVPSGQDVSKAAQKNLTTQINKLSQEKNQLRDRLTVVEKDLSMANYKVDKFGVHITVVKQDFDAFRRTYAEQESKTQADKHERDNQEVKSKVGRLWDERDFLLARLTRVEEEVSQIESKIKQDDKLEATPSASLDQSKLSDLQEYLSSTVQDAIGNLQNALKDASVKLEVISQDLRSETESRKKQGAKLESVAKKMRDELDELEFKLEKGEEEVRVKLRKFRKELQKLKMKKGDDSDSSS